MYLKGTLSSAKKTCRGRFKMVSSYSIYVSPWFS
nr:MAG TPA: hypothetical protein [Caudoviricetes sp.]